MDQEPAVALGPRNGKQPLARGGRLDRFDIGGERNARTAGQLNAWLFSDRGIYRPGDSFHIGMIVRAADWAQPLDGVPLIAEVIDPRGVRVREERLRVAINGAFAPWGQTLHEGDEVVFIPPVSGG